MCFLPWTVNPQYFITLHVLKRFLYNTSTLHYGPCKVRQCGREEEINRHNLNKISIFYLDYISQIPITLLAEWLVLVKRGDKLSRVAQFRLASTIPGLQDKKTLLKARCSYVHYSTLARFHHSPTNVTWHIGRTLQNIVVSLSHD